MTHTSSGSVDHQLAGVHHVSALSAQIGRSHDFYARVLGLRPIIKTVNQDEPSMYHLFFGDGVGSPGSDMTVFDIPLAAREHRGSGSVARSTFRVAGRPALEYWKGRLEAEGIETGDIAERDGRLSLDFEDHEGTRLALVEDGGAGRSYPWAESPVPPAQQIRGLGYLIISVAALDPTARFLTDALGMQHDHSYRLSEAQPAEVHVYRMGAGGVAAELHVAVQPEIPRSRYGAGGVHHLALRIPEGQQIGDWIERLNSVGYRNTGLVDRYYFKSVYSREPGGVLFELATDAPGFEVAGPLDGERLSLPPFLEPRRAEIEAALKPIGPP